MADFATFGEMLLAGLQEINKLFEDMETEHRFVENVDLGEEAYEVMSAKKKSGKPKDDQPSKSKLSELSKQAFQDCLTPILKLGISSECGLISSLGRLLWREILIKQIYLSRFKFSWTAVLLDLQELALAVRLALL